MPDDVLNLMSKNERSFLKKIASSADGPFLEVGVWCGGSTLTIIEAIKETSPKEFVAVDLFPTEEHFIISEDRVRDNIDGLSLSGCDRKTYDAMVLPILKQGLKNIFESNLRRYDASEYVKVVHENIHYADLPMNYFNVIFADVCHNLKEFGYNFPRLLRLASPNCLFVVHDMTFDITPLGYDIQVVDRVETLCCFTCKKI